eukprot:GSChrysophyteH1.ASY1.ANO1.1648.1 assembled CDS
MGNKKDEYRIWTAPDCAGTDYERSTNLKICIVNASNHSGLYKHDMRPVYKSNASNQKWARLKTSVKFMKHDDGQSIYFDYRVELPNEQLSFAFTFPYTYTTVQNELNALQASHENNLCDPDAIYFHRELLIKTRDGLRVDMLTISASNGADTGSWDKSPTMDDADTVSISPSETKITFDSSTKRSLVWPQKEILWVSARVHPGEVPCQHTFKGILNFLMDRTDVIAQEMRKRFVIKLIPILNPDGVYRGHFRLDQFGQNLNRYYSSPDIVEQTPIYAARKCLDYYSAQKKLSLYLDLHAHASKRGCFIYGNVMDNIDDQVQNMLYCRLIALNTPNFDYEGCLFSREHMQRIDPGDRGANLTAEGSGRVATYLQQNIVHSYTLECNYNCSKSGNDVPPVDSPGSDTGGHPSNQQAASAFTTYPDKFTPAIWASVGRACVVAMMDIREINPASRIPKSKHKTLSRYRSAVLQEVRQRKEYKQQRGGVSASQGPNAVVEAEWRPRIPTVDENDSRATNRERFPITNAPMTASDMAAARVKPRSFGAFSGRADKEKDSSAAVQAESSKGTTASRPGGRPQGTFQRGSRGSKPSTAGGSQRHSPGFGLVSAKGTTVGAPLRTSSAAASSTQAGVIDSSQNYLTTNNDHDHAKGRLRNTKAQNDNKTRVPPLARDPTPIASAIEQQQMKARASTVVKINPLEAHGNTTRDISLRDPTPITSKPSVADDGLTGRLEHKEPTEPPRVPKGPFFSSGGGPNHPNYVQGSDLNTSLASQTRGTVGPDGVRSHPSLPQAGFSRGRLVSPSRMPSQSSIQVGQQLDQTNRLSLKPVADISGDFHPLSDVVRGTLGSDGGPSSAPPMAPIEHPRAMDPNPLQTSLARLNPKLKKSFTGAGHIEAISHASAHLNMGSPDKKTSTSSTLVANSNAAGALTSTADDAMGLHEKKNRTASHGGLLATLKPRGNFKASRMGTGNGTALDRASFRSPSGHSKYGSRSGIPRPSNLKIGNKSPRRDHHGVGAAGQLSPVRGGRRI